MNKDKKICLLLVPLIFMVWIFVPFMIFDIVPNAYIQKVPFVIWYLLWLMPCIFGVIWRVACDYITIGVYIVIVVVYTVVSWIWILWRKKGDVMYFIVWSVFCVLAILMYWKWGDVYDAFLHE